MFSIGIKEFNRRIFSNLFIALQLGAVLFIIISIASSIRSRVEFYNPIKDYLEGEGVYAKLGGLSTEENFREQYPQIENILCAYNPAFQVDSAKTDIAYSQKFAESYATKLKEGKWISEIDLNSDTIYAVVNEKYKLEIGSTFKGYYTYYEPEDTTYTNPIHIYYDVEVVGIIADDTKFFGGDGYYEDDDDFRNLYGTGEGKVLILNNDQLDNLGIGSTISQRKMLIQFEDGMSDEEVSQLESYIRSHGAVISLEEFRDRSYMYVYHQLIQLFPILICIILLVIVSTVSISALNTKMSLHTYGIYYMLGCTWKGCLVINLIASVLVSACSTLMCGLTIQILKAMGKLQKTVINFSTYELKWCLLVVAGYIVISMLLPVLFMHSTTPKEHLTSNE